MKKLILASAIAVASIATFGGPAAACEVKYVGDACDQQRVQSGRPEYVGPKAPTPQDMVCLTVLANRPSALVLAQGRVAERQRVTGKVITSWRTQSSHWKKVSAGFVREICIPARMVQGTVTLCNDENRSIWNNGDTSHLRRVKRIPTNDPACLLGSKACAKLGL